VRIHVLSDIHLEATVLDNAAVDIQGVRFLGATLWSSFQLHGDSMIAIGRSMVAARQAIPDFSAIQDAEGGCLSPAQTVIMHNTSVTWLRAALAQPYAGRTVVISHHAPSPISLAEMYVRHPAAPAWASDLEYLMPSVDLWIHGHLHNRADYRVGDCRVICNPRGIDVNGSRAGFDRDLLVAV